MLGGLVLLVKSLMLLEFFQKSFIKQSCVCQFGQKCQTELTETYTLGLKAEMAH